MEIVARSCNGIQATHKHDAYLRDGSAIRKKEIQMQELSKLILVTAVFLAFALIVSGYAIWSGQTSMFRTDSMENNYLGDMLIYIPDVQALRDQ